MLDKLLTEQPNPASASIDTLPTEQALRIINAEDQRVADAVEREIPAIARAVDAIVAALEHGGRLFYIGAGTSGRLGVLDASECPPTFSVPPEMVQGIMAGGEAALAAPPKPPKTIRPSACATCRSAASPATDVLVGIAASGRTPYVLGAVAEARRAGRGDRRHQLHARFGAVARRGFRDRAAARAGNRGRLHAHEGRHRAEAGPQHALYRQRSSGWATFTAT